MFFESKKEKENEHAMKNSLIVSLNLGQRINLEIS